MELFMSLWLPILASAVALQIASTIVWTVMPHHKKDFVGVRDEDGVMKYVRGLNLPKGNYMFPYCGDHKAANTPEAKAKYKEGPVGTLTILGQPNMGRNMGLTFLVFLTASALIAYLAAITLPAGAPFAKVFQAVGTAGVLTYTFAGLPHQIWFGAYGRTMVASIADGIAYGLITGAVFAWLWPKAAVLTPAGG